jgi:hypothetical protein
MNKPLCLVFMPFGKTTDTAGARDDFDAAYKTLIAPAIEAAGMEPVRAGEESASAASSNDPLLYQLLENFSEVAHTKTDVFRERVRYSARIKERLAAAREQGAGAVRAIERGLPSFEGLESAVLIDLMLSYRAVKAWPEMIAWIGKMPPPLAATVMVREQLAFALNRAGRGVEAERTLLALLELRGPSSETFALLGRVYKDRWETALKRGETEPARVALDSAIDAYRRGFETDWRDAYPGINALTLMELREPPDPRRGELLPIVAYAVERRVAAGKPDYWDYATQIELAVLAKDEQKARSALNEALARVREAWEPETTARNLRLIREARDRRQEVVPWARRIEDELERKTRA